MADVGIPKQIHYERAHEEKREHGCQYLCAIPIAPPGLEENNSKVQTG